METSPAIAADRFVGIARALSLLIMLLMLIAGVYGGVMAVRLYSRIGV